MNCESLHKSGCYTNEEACCETCRPYNTGYPGEYHTRCGFCSPPSQCVSNVEGELQREQDCKGAVGELAFPP